MRIVTAPSDRPRDREAVRHRERRGAGERRGGGLQRTPFPLKNGASAALVQNLQRHLPWSTTRKYATNFPVLADGWNGWQSGAASLATAPREWTLCAYLCNCVPGGDVVNLNHHPIELWRAAVRESKPTANNANAIHPSTIGSIHPSRRLPPCGILYLALCGVFILSTARRRFTVDTNDGTKQKKKKINIGKTITCHGPYCVQFGEKHQSVDFLHKSTSNPPRSSVPFRRPEKGEAQALIETSAKNGPGTFLPRVKFSGIRRMRVRLPRSSGDTETESQEAGVDVSATELGGVAPAPILPKSRGFSHQPQMGAKPSVHGYFGTYPLFLRHAQASQAGGSTAGQCALERWALGRVSRSYLGPAHLCRYVPFSLLAVPRLPRPSPFLSRRLSQFPLVTGSKSSPSSNCPVFSRPFLGFYSLFCRRCTLTLFTCAEHCLSSAPSGLSLGLSLLHLFSLPSRSCNEATPRGQYLVRHNVAKVHPRVVHSHTPHTPPGPKDHTSGPQVKVKVKVEHQSTPSKHTRTWRHAQVTNLGQGLRTDRLQGTDAESRYLDSCTADTPGHLPSLYVPYLIPLLLGTPTPTPTT
ncbi:uncharacterized protein CLUP02_14271 [Colletotrichum lupini]|uniref:Uncharacterized protein n=1 Tax=Colletotrichum lupini TaxID=145971 RepID=A0A9Q8WMK3_9PEZI|nr:uncharacterized protein CLUP02_14271 [Colletotrichum lupini]UQC88746.1 hypothetical protein CLUP02_14271 [Colletotrichum lupini]